MSEGRPPLRIALLAAAFAGLTLAVMLRSAWVEARLVKSDPDALPHEQALMEYARLRGAALFEERCAGCHGSAGEGDARSGAANLRDADWLYGTGSVGDIEQVVKYGIRSYHPRTWNLAIMPAYATARPSARDPKIQPLTPSGIRDLVEFLWREQGREADVAAAARGEESFRGAGGCYDCHAGDAKGDPAIGAPNLTDRITLYGDGSRNALGMSIAYGRHGVCPSWSSRLKPAAIREVALFAHSLSHPGDAR
jgi:cytochrome c oxidase cbb3-type subunit 3